MARILKRVAASVAERGAARKSRERHSAKGPAKAAGKSFDRSVEDFLQAIGQFVRLARAAVATEGLSWGETGVLKRLAEAPRTTAELARAQGMRPQSMGTIVASLEEMGLVEKRPHPSDGRQMNLVLTAKGESAKARAGEIKREWLAAKIGELEAGEQAALFTAGEIIERLASKGKL